jgi:hypothetical protein
MLRLQLGLLAYVLTKHESSLQNRDVLTLQAEHKAEKEEEDEKKQYHLVERSFGKFMRTFELPFEADTDKVEATFDKGVLKISVLDDGGKENASWDRLNGTSKSMDVRSRGEKHARPSLRNG